jgi:hypothetical protein
MTPTHGQEAEQAAILLLGRLLDGTARIEQWPMGMTVLIDPECPPDEIRIVTSGERLTIKLSATQGKGINA